MIFLEDSQQLNRKAVFGREDANFSIFIIQNNDITPYFYLYYVEFLYIYP